MKIIFFGSDHFSLSSLKACLDSPQEVLLVVTTPDQKKGRGLNSAPTPVKVFAQEKKIALRDPKKLKDPALIDEIKTLDADLFVVSSYGNYIPSAYLELPRTAALNVHPSLLPKYRGCSPIQSAILNGDPQTGVSIIEVAKKLDAGDIFYQKAIPVEPKDNAVTLTEKLAGLSYEAVRHVLKLAGEGPLARTPQSEASSSYTEKLKKEDGLVSFHISAEELDRKIRGLTPWPGTYIRFQDSRLSILEAEILGGGNAQKPGTLLEITPDGGLVVATANNPIKLTRVQLAGKRVMPAADFARGRHLKPGFTFDA